VTSQDGPFPLTRHSVVLAAQSNDLTARSLAIETIALAYWRPIYKYVRMKWDLNPEVAADFTQEFFAHLVEKEFLKSYDSRKGRLRTFLRVCVDRLFMNQMRDSQRLKRGGGGPHCSLDFEEAEREFATVPSSECPESCFDREWVRTVFALSLQRLQAICEASGKMVHFELFELYDLQDADPKPSYRQLATKFVLAITDVTNYLAFVRREFRRCVLDQLREMTASDEEFRREAQALLGIHIR
jgi:DNA-directed RNA polymerase specialized sigma24 family protein